MYSRCSICNKELTTGDFNGICQKCRNKGHHEFDRGSSAVKYLEQLFSDDSPSVPPTKEQVLAHINKLLELKHYDAGMERKVRHADIEFILRYLLQEDKK